MQQASLPPNETTRIAALRALHILDTPPEERFDRITRLAQKILDAPIALVSLVDANRQWSKSCAGLDVPETPRAISFCAHAILGDDTFIIPDAHADPRFADNPLVTGAPYVRFYAGQPLKSTDGHNLGTLCVIDRAPRQLSASDRRAFKDLATLARDELNAVQLNDALALYRESEARVHAVLDSVAEALVLISPAGRLVSTNRWFNEFFGTTPDLVLGRQISELRPLIERVFVNPTTIDQALQIQADTEQTIVTLVSQSWPEPRELELFSVPVYVSTGQSLGRLYVFRDVTRERQVDRMKDEFVSLVSHELRTPLTSIKGFTDLLVGGEVGEVSEEQREYLSIIKKSADRLVALVNNLLDISRIETGQIQLNKQSVDLSEKIQMIVKTMTPQIRGKLQSLSVEMDPALPRIEYDPDSLAQVLMNLVSNAHKYTPSGGTIRVRATRAGDFLRVSVKDAGIGIAPEEQKRLFTKFYRADNPVTRETRGTGLGLAITKALVELHGGQVFVDSQPGQGSTFSFTIPLAH